MDNQAIPTLLPVYARADLVFERGEGAWLITADGRRFLDFASGVAVTALGHAHPHLVRTVQEQAARMWHVSNLFRIAEAERLADRLVAHSFADTVFVCNSGAEAMEACIKMARRYHWHRGSPERNRIVTFEGSFHGRTMATISAAGAKKLVEGFDPLLDGFDVVPFGDHAALREAVTERTAAILIEPVQGEGGIRTVPEQCLIGLRQICDAEGILLIFDEVQTGMARTGTLFAYEQAGITPDIMGLAKGLGGGFPVGACLATARAASGMTPGSHGSTYGGNPMACAVANAVLDVMLEGGFLDAVQKRAKQFHAGLAEVVGRHPDVLAEVRGLGLLTGVTAQVPNGELAAKLREHEMLSVLAGDNVVRLLPPLIIDENEVALGLERLDAACRELTP
ncbi:MAG: aspartate aminotransferase family protein [Geminicoccaceae bacterium]